MIHTHRHNGKLKRNGKINGNINGKIKKEGNLATVTHGWNLRA